MKINTLKLSLIASAFTLSLSAAATDDNTRGAGSLTQNCVYNVEQTAGDTRFVLSNSGASIHDLQTNLVWSRCDAGQIWSQEDKVCLGTQETVHWLEAHLRASSYNADDYNDWRVPNIKELYSIVESRCAKPAINADIFSSTKSDDVYFSSTVNNLSTTGDTAFAFTIRIGQVLWVSKDDLLKVKFVRDAD